MKMKASVVVKIIIVKMANSIEIASQKAQEHVVSSWASSMYRKDVLDHVQVMGGVRRPNGWQVEVAVYYK